MVWNTIMQLEDEVDSLNSEQWTFEDLYKALPDKFKIKEDPRPTTQKMRDWQFSDYLKENLTQQQIKNSMISVDVSRLETFPPQRQLIGSCGGEAGANIMESFENQRLGVESYAVRLSGQFVFWCAEQLDEHPEEGTYGWAVCEALREYGACRNELYSEVNNFKKMHKPSPEAFKDAANKQITSYYQAKTIQEIAIALNLGMEVWLGVQCHTGWGYAVDLPKSSDRMLGGHAIKVSRVNFEKQDVQIYNSWGMVGDGSGHHFMTFPYLQKYLIEARVIVK